MSNLPRVRFAPSPTGYLHVGGARTALFNWLYARHTGGTIVLRIEDTDRARSTDEHTQVILDGMNWLGLDWDEGPFFQGAFADRHTADAMRLLEAGKAYKDFMTADELSAARSAAKEEGETFRFKRDTAGLDRAESNRREAAGLPYAVRFQVPDGPISWDDAVHGTITWQGEELDDFIILRADGSAIYNLAVVSDDAEMKISHVIRGDDHLSNTPKQIALYKALGIPVPIFAHVPMILGDDGRKLSKRHGATAVGDYREEGILPAAMRNFLSLLGWSPGNDQEVMPMEELISRFDLPGIMKKPAAFDHTKLEWMNGQYLSQLPAEELLEPVARELDSKGVVVGDRDILGLIDAVKARARTVTMVASQVAARLPGATLVRDAKADKLIAKMGERFSSNLVKAGEALATVPEGEWTASSLEAVLKEVAERDSLKLGDLMQPVRVALTGGTVSEPVNLLLEVVGREESLRRIASG